MRRRQMMHLAAGHSPPPSAHAKPTRRAATGPHYVSIQAGSPCELNGGPAPASDCMQRQDCRDAGGGGLKNRLRRPAAASQQKKSQTITTIGTSSSSSLPCCCRLRRVIDTTKTSKPISILKKTNTFKSSSSQKPRGTMLLRQTAPHQQGPPSAAAAAASSSSFSQHNQQGLHQSGPTSNGHQPSGQATADYDDDEMQMIKKVSRDFAWTWDENCCSHSTRECQINRNGDKMEVCFHPLGSESTAACRGAKPLVRNGNYYYWELTVSEKCYGTSVMFGLCTSRQNLHALDYCNIIGLDECGWSLSHKGLIWHDGKSRQYTTNFPTNQQITIGLLFNTMRGELSYFMDGKNLGVAFCGLNDIEDDLYPAVGSTAKNTKIRITGSYCGYVSLLERSCFSILKCHSHNREQLLDYLKRCQLPRNLIEYLSQVAELCGSPIAIKTTNHQEQIEENNNNNNNNTDRMIIAQI